MKAVVRISLLIGVVILSSKSVVAQDPDSTEVVQFLADTTQVFENVVLPADVLAAPTPMTTLTAFPRVSVTNRATIDFLVYELYLTEEETITRLDFVDVTTNGFGPDDVVIYYPSQRASFLGPDIAFKAQDLMSHWTFESEFQENVELGKSVEYYDPEYPGNDSLITDQLAENALLSDVLLAVRRAYGDFRPINLLLQRGQNGLMFQLWGFDEQSMQFREKPPGIPDTLTVFDLLFVTRSDSLIRADTTLYDLLYLTRTVQDTVYFPVGTTTMPPPTGNQPVNKTPSGEGNESNGSDRGIQQRVEIPEPKSVPRGR